MRMLKQVLHFVLSPTCSESIISIQKSSQPNYLHKHASEFFLRNWIKMYSKNFQTMINWWPVFLTLVQNWRENFLRGFPILYPSTWQVIPAWWHLSSLRSFSLINRLQTWKAVAMLVFLAMFLCLNLQMLFLYCSSNPWLWRDCLTNLYNFL